jgi:predicted lysophospholipase L1 biosynthesis ABC-type transport system permease subunit
MSRVFLRLLIAEILVIPIVTLFFKVVENRMLAGAMAGGVFVALGLFIFFEGMRSRYVRRSPTFALGCIHLFVISLPLMITRLANSALAFDQVLVLGLPGPLFHQISTGIYFVLMAATLFDVVRSRRLARA